MGRIRAKPRKNIGKSTENLDISLENACISVRLMVYYPLSSWDDAETIRNRTGRNDLEKEGFIEEWELQQGIGG